jgi:hypothetical protein
MRKPMTLRDAFAIGRRYGQDIAAEVLRSDPSIDAEAFWDAVYEGAEHASCYSPFEFYAAAMNRRQDPDSAWQRYDEGLTSGAKATARRQGRRDVLRA